MAIVLDHLKRGPAAGGNVGEIGLIAELLDGRSGIAAAADGEGVALKLADGFADGDGPGLELTLLEYAHRAVPEHHLGFEDGFLVKLAGLRADVDPLEPGGDPAFAILDDAAFGRLEFVGDDGILVAHNASFDMSFINHELQGCGYPVYEWDRVIDTLEIARQKFPHSKVNLDALCKRFGVDNTSRTLHGALLDAQLLAEVYLELLGGQEPSMQLGENAHRDSAVAKTVSVQSLKRQFRPARDFPLSAEDLAAHEDFMTNKIKDSVWNAPLETAPAESE